MSTLLSRRHLLAKLAAAMAAPKIIQYSHLMPVKVIKPEALYQIGVRDGGVYNWTAMPGGEICFPGGKITGLQMRNSGSILNAKTGTSMLRILRDWHGGVSFQTGGEPDVVFDVTTSTGRMARMPLLNTSFGTPVMIDFSPEGQGIHA